MTARSTGTARRRCGCGSPSAVCIHRLDPSMRCFAERQVGGVKRRELPGYRPGPARRAGIKDFAPGYTEGVPQALTRFMPTNTCSPAWS